jgi:predicted transcriptional regulator
MTNEQFDTIRRNAEITSAEIADYLGASRSYIVKVETGREPVTPSMVKALEALVEQRQGA